ncbi:MAG: hypothetical protein AVDCRST_MAG66-3610, partial [uncultured Pseudonocardia sp.]
GRTGAPPRCAPRCRARAGRLRFGPRAGRPRRDVGPGQWWGASSGGVAPRAVDHGRHRRAGRDRGGPGARVGVRAGGPGRVERRRGAAPGAGAGARRAGPGGRGNHRGHPLDRYGRGHPVLHHLSGPGRTAGARGAGADGGERVPGRAGAVPARPGGADV